MAAMLWVVLLARRLSTAESRIAVPLQDKIIRQENRLQEAKDINRSRDMFLAALSHELRTPLSGIVGAANLLDQTGLDARQQEYARLITNAGTTVLEIVDDMLMFARVQAGKAETACTTFSVHQLVDGMLALQGFNARERGLTLVANIASDVPVVLTGERGKLNQILLNVIGNAIKFTNKGSVHVEVTRHRDDGRQVWLQFKVTDTGIGVDASAVDELFTPFFQARSDDTDRGGTGLGLAICRRLLHTMGGEIHIDGKRGQGSTVTFAMPFRLLAQAAMFAFDEVATKQAGRRSDTSADTVRMLTSTAGLLVLVVEDDEINRLVCMRILALLGYHPMVAADSAQMLQIIHEGRHRPDAILMDINLDGESGAVLTAGLQEAFHGAWKDIPVIAMSADVSGAAQQASLEAGAVDFIRKPFSADELQAVLLSVLKQPAGQIPFADATGKTHVSETAADPLLRARVNLDEAWLAQEIEDLGMNTVLEMLNIFRATAATTLRALSGALRQQDHARAAELLHKLTGSALNLGMRGVAARARSMQAALDSDEAQAADLLKQQLDRLEACCHLSADLVRSRLVVHAKERVALATCSNK
ncbi:MAG TPA: ATP-binding protein [Burkholderiaceae bacterium]|nr:ATP-binding protein [Burkholderiaceae bacterium]